MPSILAWTIKVPAPAKRFVLERNPYYWKVDTAGNQLPYIDAIVNDLQAEAQTILLKAIAGEIDMQGRSLGGMQNSVLLRASEAQGKYRLVPKTGTASVGVLLAPNLNHKDPVMRSHTFRSQVPHRTFSRRQQKRDQQDSVSGKRRSSTGCAPEGIHLLFPFIREGLFGI